jgi:hypothetical protein
MDNTSVTDMEPDCTHVAPGDDPFKARMRFHQSWYRRHVLGLPPGTNPSAKNPDELYGSRLTPEDAMAGRNFLTPAIHAAAERRLSIRHGVVESERLRGNLLSSQPVCFNLWAPLADDPALATRLVQRLGGFPAELRVTNVALEYAPDKTRHLNDNTAFDAFVECELPGGNRGFVGVETKLTEPFGPKRVAFEPRYSEWMNARGWWWRERAERSFPDPRINQLWRNHLLAFAMLRQEPPEYSEGFCAVLYHDDDASCVEAMQAYRAHLLPESELTLLDWPLSAMVDAWTYQLETPEQQSWLDRFRLRYLDLGASDAAWSAFQRLAQGPRHRI